MARDRILITGISSNLGRTLVKLLHRTEKLVGLDRRAFLGRPKDLEIHQVDLRKRKVEEIFRKGDLKALIHMAIIHDKRLRAGDAHAFNVLGTKAVLELAAKYHVPKVVVLSSGTIYGPSPNNDNFLHEDAPLLGSQRFAGIRDLIEVDMIAQQSLWKQPSVETVILRPVHIVGPTIHNAPANYLRLHRPWTLAGFDPMVQFIHEEDVGRAMQAALQPGKRGVFNVVGPGEIPLSCALDELGRSPIPVPKFVARALLARLFNARITTFPPDELDHLQFLCCIDGSRFEKDFAFRPSYTLKETIRSLLGEVSPRVRKVDELRVT